MARPVLTAAHFHDEEAAFAFVEAHLWPDGPVCPFCGQMVRLHVNKAGRRHVFAHARALYEGSRYGVHYAAEIRCLGSGVQAQFDPRPGERQHFKLPNSLLEE